MLPLIDKWWVIHWFQQNSSYVCWLCISTIYELLWILSKTMQNCFLLESSPGLRHNHNFYICHVLMFGWFDDNYLYTRIKTSSYITQFSILGMVQCVLLFTPWQTCSIATKIGVSGKHRAKMQWMRENYYHCLYYHCL